MLDPKSSSSPPFIASTSTSSSPLGDGGGVGSAESVTANRCRVCDRSYDGSQHFGIDICRACAAFFRRSVRCKKSFVCRRGSGNCHLNTSRKVTCQKCRWVRCLQVGLQVDVVHGRRSPETSTKTKTEDDYDYNSGDASDSKSIGDVEEVTSALTAPPLIFKPKPLHMTIDVENARTNLIQKMLVNYREFSSQRLEIEQNVPVLNDEEVVLNGRKMLKTSRQRLSIIYQNQLPLLHNFLLKTFDKYSSSPQLEQKRICALFYPVLWEVESNYWNYRFLTNETAKNRLLTTQTTFIDTDDIKFWLNDNLPDNQINHVESVIRKLLIQGKEFILRPMHSLIISEVEFVVLLALNIWSPRNHRVSEEADQAANEVRSRIFDDLHILYRHEMKMDNYAKRMGDLMCLYTDVQTVNISSTIQSILFPNIIDFVNSQ